MRVRATTDAPPETGADTIAVGIFEGEKIAHDVDGILQGLVESGEARTGLRKVAVAHAGGRRYVLAGLGRRDAFDDDHVAALVEATPLRRMTEPDELGRLAVFLTSDLARCITGQFIIADAGAFLSRTRPANRDPDADRAAVHDPANRPGGDG